MAAPVVVANLTNITLAETGTWVEFGSGQASIFDGDTRAQGSLSRTKKNSSGTRGMAYDNGSGIDFTVSGRYLWIWLLCNTPDLLDTIANGGMAVRVGSTTSALNDYYVAGSDTDYAGDWVRIVIDLNKTPSAQSGGGCDLTSVRYFGGIWTTTGTVKGQNIGVDRIDYGDGIRIEQGDSADPANWKSLFDEDMGNTSNRYGVVQQNRAGDFELYGTVQIGDGAGTDSTLWLETSGRGAKFVDHQYWDGNSMVSAVDGSLYKIEGLGNGTGTTDIDFGEVVGSGDQRQGINGGVIGTAGPKFELDFETDIADLDSVNLYGVTIQGAGLTQFSGSTKTDIIGCQFVNCGEIQPNDAEFLNNTIVAPVPGIGLELLTTHNAKQCTFVAGGNEDERAARAYSVDISGPTVTEETDDFASTTAADVLPFPATEAVGDYFAIGSRRRFGKATIDVGTARSGGALAIEYWDGSAWSAVSVINDATNTLSTAGSNDLDFNVPDDWAETAIDNEAPLYYIRWRVTTVMTTNPVIDEGFVGDFAEHHVHFASAGDYTITLDDMEFFGFGSDGLPKWHGLVDQLNSDVTVTALGRTNMSENEVEVTDGGTITVNVSVNLEINGLPEATYAVFIGSGGAEDGNELLAGYANASGLVSGTFGGTTPQTVTVKARNSGIVAAAILEDPAASFTDYTLDAREQVGADDVVVVPDSPAVNDAFYIGGVNQYGRVQFNVSSAGATYAGTWEYWDGSGWTAIADEVDDTNGFQTAGWNFIEFTKPSDWATTSINSQGPYYFIRFRITTGAGAGNGANVEYVTLFNTVKYEPHLGTAEIVAVSGRSVTVTMQETSIPG